MEYKELRSKIFDIDKSIRFVGLINKSGKLVDGGMREGIQSIDDEIHQKRWFNQVAMRAEMYEMFTRIYGQTQFVYVVREKLKQMTFYRGKNIVLVTIQPSVDDNSGIEIARKVLKVLDDSKII